MSNLVFAKAAKVRDSFYSFVFCKCKLFLQDLFFGTVRPRLDAVVIEVTNMLPSG